MISFQEILNNPIVNRIGFALMHSVWQCTVIAVLFAFIMIVLRKRRAQIRYNIAFGALLLMVLLPALTLCMVKVETEKPVVQTKASVILPASEKPIDPVAAKMEIPAEETDIVFHSSETVESAEIPEVAAAAEKDTADADISGVLERVEAVVPHFAVAWIVGVFVLSIWHLGGWAQLRRLRGTMVKPVEDHVVEKLQRLAGLMGVDRAFETVESALVTVPTVIGAMKPVVLLPASALTGLSADQLEMILAHELAHIKRNDYLFNLIQTAIDILLFYHPAAWYVSRVIRTERENCCDDIAVKVTGDNIKYARALATLEEIKAENRRLAVAATGGNLFDRVERLVGKEESRSSKPAWQTVVITMLVVTAVVMPLCFAMNKDADESKTKQPVEEDTNFGEELKEVKKSVLSFRFIGFGDDVKGKHFFYGKPYKEKYTKLLMEKGPDPSAYGNDDNDLRWFEVNELVPDWAYIKEYEGKKYVMMTNSSWALAPSEKPHYDWGLIEVKAFKNDDGKFDVAYETDREAGRSLKNMTGNSKGYTLAVLIDDDIVNVFKVEEPLSEKGIIRLGLSEKEANDIAASLRTGMPASMELYRLITSWSSKEDNLKEKIKRLIANNNDLLRIRVSHDSSLAEAGNPPLITAVNSNRDAEFLRYMLDNGAIVNQTGENGQTALHYAARYNKKEAMEVLIERGADINALDHDGLTPLTSSMFSEFPSSDELSGFELLLEHGADVNAKGQGGISALSMAVIMKGSYEGQAKRDSARKDEAQKAVAELSKVIDKLLTRGARKDIFSASGLGDLSTMRTLIKKDPSAVNASGAYDLKPLHIAVFADQKDAAILLLESGADLKAKSGQGTALEIAAVYGNLGMIETLEKYLREMGGKYHFDKEVLFKAASGGHTDILSHLLDNGFAFNPDTASEYGETCLYSAAGQGRLDAVKLLIERGADVNLARKDGKSPLIQAVLTAAHRNSEEYVDVIKLLIESGANVNAVTKDGSSALFNLCEFGTRSGKGNDIIKQLLDNGADINIKRRSSNDNLLSFAVRANDFDRVRILLDAGADPFETVGFHTNIKYPLDIAKQSKLSENIVQLIEEHMAEGFEKTNKEIMEMMDVFIQAIIDNDSEALKKVTLVPSDHGKEVWEYWLKSIRKEYENNFELFKQIKMGKFIGGWADVFVKKPESSKEKYSMFTLMQMPDDKWKVIKYTKIAHVNPGYGATNSAGFLKEFRAKIFDDAGKTESLQVSGSLGTGLKGQTEVSFDISKGKLQADFGGSNLVEAGGDVVKFWRDDELHLCRKLDLKLDQAHLSAENESMTLSGFGKKYIIDEKNGKVRVQSAGEMIAHSEKVTLELPNLKMITELETSKGN